MRLAHSAVQLERQQSSDWAAVCVARERARYVTSHARNRQPELESQYACVTRVAFVRSAAQGPCCRHESRVSRSPFAMQLARTSSWASKHKRPVVLALFLPSKYAEQLACTECR